MNAIRARQCARNIIKANQYMTIASADAKGQAWVSPVAYAIDRASRLYFISLPHSKHVTNFRAKPRVSVAIFDSRQAFGEGVGLQIEGTIKIVKSRDVARVERTYVGRSYPFTSAKHKTYLAGCRTIIRDQSYAMYCFTPTKVWMNDPESEVDRRIEVKL